MKMLKLLAPCPIGEFRELYTVNSQGYRCPEFETIEWEKSILTLGCSHTFGVGAADDCTVAAQLQLLLNEPVINLGQGATGYSFSWMNSTLLKKHGVRPKAVVYIWPDYSRQSIFKSYDLTSPELWGSWNLDSKADRNSTGIVLTTDEYQSAAMAHYYSENLQVLWDCPVLQYSHCGVKPPHADWIKMMPHWIDVTPVDPLHPGIKTNIERAKQIASDLTQWVA